MAKPEQYAYPLVIAAGIGTLWFLFNRGGTSQTIVNQAPLNIPPVQVNSLVPANSVSATSAPATAAATAAACGCSNPGTPGTPQQSQYVPASQGTSIVGAYNGVYHPSVDSPCYDVNTGAIVDCGGLQSSLNALLAQINNQV